MGKRGNNLDFDSNCFIMLPFGHFRAFLGDIDATSLHFSFAHGFDTSFYVLLLILIGPGSVGMSIHVRIQNKLIIDDLWVSNNSTLLNAASTGTGCSIVLVTGIGTGTSW